MANENTIADLTKEIELLERRWRLVAESIQERAERCVNGGLDAHAGNNIGNLAQELTELAGRVAQTRMILGGLLGSSLVLRCGCGKAFLPYNGETTRCPECLGAQHAAAERAGGVQ